MRPTLRKITSTISLGILLTLGNNTAVNAQSSAYCPNADFEMGDFTNWQGYTGVFSQLPSVPNPGIVAGRHTIISTAALDPFTCNNLQVLPAVAGNYVCRLGNSSVGAQTERIVYTMSVDSNNALFVYRYAVVLEDPGHSPADQPRFQIRVLDSLGNVIDPICGQYFVQSGQNIPGFQFCATEQTVWKDWTTVGVSLISYIGQTIQLEFTTADCALSGHFGYAYLEAYCMPMAIQSEFCIGASQVILYAPPGFSSYLWSTGDTTISTVVNNPVIGQQVQVTLTTVQNCNLTLTTTLNSTIISPSYSVQITDPCNPTAAVQFNDSTTIINGTLVGWNWNFGDGSPIDTNQNPSHNFPTAGSYQVTLYAYSLSGCVDSITTTVNLFSPAVAAFANNTACLGDATIFADQSTAGNDTVATWAWDFGDSNTSNVQNPQHTYAAANTYQVTLIITTNVGCTDTLVQNVTVNPLPVLVTTPPPSICVGDVTVLGVSGADTYVWSPATALSATTGSSVTANPTDTITYTVTGTDTNGCSSSATIFVDVNPLPIVLTPADPEVCAGGCIVLNLTGADFYSWSPPDYITTSSPDSGVVTVCPAVTVIYTVTGNSLEGCTASVTFDVEVNPNPTPVITPDGATTFCDGNSVNLFVTPVATGDTILWSNGDMDDSVHVVSTETFTVSITDANGCYGISPSLTVTVNPIPVAQISPPGPLTICTGFPATLYATTGAGYSYQWFLNSAPISGATDTSYEANVNGTYTLQVIAAGCTAVSNQVLVVLGLGPDVSITVSPTIGCLQNTIYIGYGPQSITLTAVTNPVDSTFTFLWSTGEQTQSINVVTSGEYSVTAFDANGCPSPNPAVLTPPINVVDIRCGTGKKKIILCHVPEGNPSNPQTLCLGPPSIPPHLALHQYDCLGPCSLYYPRMMPTIESEDDDFFVMSYPNPFNNGFNLYILSASTDEVKVNIYDMVGRLAERYDNVTEETLIGAKLSEGMYTAEVMQGDNRKMLNIIKSK